MGVGSRVWGVEGRTLSVKRGVRVIQRSIFFINVSSLLETFINFNTFEVVMEHLIEVLKKWNPWERKLSSGVLRKQYIQKLFSYLGRKEILVLKGVRRSGKSTLMKQLMDELITSGIDARQILYLNLEEYSFADHLTLTLFDEVFAVYLSYSKNKKKTYFFIDEAQNIPEWEKWVRTQYDSNENIKFIVTGSSASLLSRELSTLLTGRNLSFTIRPLSFTEYFSFTKKGSVEDYLKYGGFPEVVLEPSEEKKEKILRQYFEDIIHKDIVDRHSIKNTKQLLDLARYLVSSSGSKVSVNKLSKMFGSAKDTIQTYINYMIDAFLLFEVPYFSYSEKVKHEVSKLPKLYCTDLGFMTITKTTRSNNNGQVFENAVFQKISEQEREVMYWNDGSTEVDFVSGNMAVNVTATDSPPEREQRGLAEFKKHHTEFTTLLITKTANVDGTLSLVDFLKTE